MEINGNCGNGRIDFESDHGEARGMENTGETILFVDDEESLLNIAREYFQHRGYRVVTAGDGIEALNALRNEHIDCCFTDINMPRMDGLQLAEHLRNIDNTIPVVVMTGFPSLDNTIKTLKNGVVDFLIKPVNLNQMEVCVRSVLRERQLFIDNIFLKKELEKQERLEKLNRELRNKVDELQIFTRIMEDFTRVEKSLDVFELLVKMTLEIARADTAIFYVVNEVVQKPVEVAAFFAAPEAASDDRSGRGCTVPSNNGRSMEGLESLIMEIASGGDKKPIIIPEDHESAALPSGIRSFLAVPLIIRDKVFGVLTASVNQEHSKFNGKVLYYLSFMAGKAAYAIENLALYENIYENLLATLDALVQAIEAKDFYTKQHSRQVTGIAVALAREMGCGQEDVDILEVAGPLHDIGKIGVPDHILLKPGRLTDQEYEIIKTHPTIGADIVGQLGLWEREQQVIRHHHERFDGTGYPFGLSGEEIPLLARIISVADVFDAMASDRVYRKKMDESRVVETICKGADTQFDPRVVRVFHRLYQSGRIHAF
jgi:putative nucleotidyltransferase with HDIG domain